MVMVVVIVVVVVVVGGTINWQKISRTGSNGTDSIDVGICKRHTMLVFVAHAIHGEQFPPATVQMHLAVLVFFPSTVHVAHNPGQGLP